MNEANYTVCALIQRQIFEFKMQLGYVNNCLAHSSAIDVLRYAIYASIKRKRSKRKTTGDVAQIRQRYFTTTMNLCIWIGESFKYSEKCLLLFNLFFPSFHLFSGFCQVLHAGALNWKLAGVWSAKKNTQKTIYDLWWTVARCKQYIPRQSAYLSWDRIGSGRLLICFANFPIAEHANKPHFFANILTKKQHPSWNDANANNGNQFTFYFDSL